MDYHTGSLPLATVMKPPFSIEVPGAVPVPGETIPRRNPKARDGLIERPAPDIDTAFALLQKTSAKYANEPAVASRKFISLHKQTKQVNKVIDGEVRKVDKEWQFFELDNYTYQTYAEFSLLTRQIGAGLRKLGLETYDHVHVFAGTSQEWLAIAHGCASQSFSIVTAYDTLGEAGVQHSLTQTGAKAMFLDPHLFKVAEGPLKVATAVRYIIYNDATHQPVADSVLDNFRAGHPHLKVLSFSELRTLGEGPDGPKDEPALPPVPPVPTDTFCIMYTSGSTGLPKGVPVTHASFVASVAGLNSNIEEVVSHNDTILAYLPLAHIFELVLENLVLFVGATLGYGSPRTLTDGSMLKGCPGDLRAFKPTILVGVPQVWEQVRKGVASGVDKASPVAKALFWTHYSIKSALLQSGLLTGPIATAISYVDSIVFKQVSKTTGGNLRFIVNGASAIANDTMSFMSLVVAPMINGYGLTETGGNGALGSPLQWTDKAVGPMGAAVEIKLVGQPDLGYNANPPEGSNEDAHGEVLIRGLPVLKSYYKNPAETAASITADGWFRTGDIGAFDRKTGHLRLVDRLKNLVKMQGGEYIALEKLEAIYRGADPVQNIMVYADSLHARPVAIVCINEKAVAAIAKKLGVSTDETEGVRDDEKVRAQVLKEILSVGKQAGLAPLEMLSGISLTNDEWTPASGEVTATQKLNRRTIKDKYKKEIEAAFAGK